MFHDFFEISALKAGHFLEKIEQHRTILGASTLSKEPRFASKLSFGNFEQKIHFSSEQKNLRAQKERRSLMVRARARAALFILSESASASGALYFGQERERERRSQKVGSAQ